MCPACDDVTVLACASRGLSAFVLAELAPEVRLARPEPENRACNTLCTSVRSRITTQHLLVSTKHLYTICTMLDQRRRRCADVVQMLFKMFCVCRPLTASTPFGYLRRKTRFRVAAQNRSFFGNFVLLYGRLLITFNRIFFLNIESKLLTPLFNITLNMVKLQIGRVT